MDAQKNTPIQGPLTLTLHDDGADYFIQKGQRIAKVKLFDGTEEFGIVFPSSEAKGIQRMAVVGYIHRIEYTCKAIVDERSNIIDLTKLMSYGMLYRQFDARVWDILLSSELAALWNRQYPKLSISFGMDTRKLGLAKVFQANEATITTFKQMILRAIQEMVAANAKLLEEEKRKQMFLAIRFINMVDPFVWLLLAIFQNTPGSQNLLKEIQRLLITYLTKSDSPEYLSLMLIELILIVGGITAASGTEDLGSAGHDPVYVGFQFSARKREYGERTRMRVTIARGDAEYSTLKHVVDTKNTLDLREKSLDAFFVEAGEQSYMNKDIGMYYLSYLKDACKKMNINFESYVNVVPSTNQSIMNLVLTF